MQDSGPVFFCCNIFIWFWDWSNACWHHERSWKVIPLALFLRKDCGELLFSMVEFTGPWVFGKFLLFKFQNMYRVIQVSISSWETLLFCVFQGTGTFYSGVKFKCI